MLTVALVQEIHVHLHKMLNLDTVQYLVHNSIQIKMSHILINGNTIIMLLDPFTCKHLSICISIQK